MKCTECNKNFKPARNDAKFCSDKCRNRNYKRRKKEDIVFKEQEKEALGQVQEQQKKKVVDLDRQINFVRGKIKEFQQEFKDLKEQEAITIVKLKKIQKPVKENDQKIQKIEAILSLNDKKFYHSYCDDVETKADLGFILNLFINDYLLSEVNANERNREIKRMKTVISGELTKLQKVLKEDRIYFKEVYQKLMTIREKLKKKRKVILVGIEKVKELEEQKTIPVKQPKIKKSPPQKRVQNNDSKNGVSGAELLNMTFNTFTLDGELGRFLGELDRNMTAFALTGDSGAGKSYFSFELAKVFVENGFSAKYFALEEGLGKLTQNKVREYDLGNDITITGNGTLRDVRRDAKQYDLIVIDSFQKLNAKAEEFERLRQDFPKTIFIIIFQKTASGSMRGGSSIKFNSSATIDVQIRDNERVAVMEKGRYGTIGWVYSIDEERIIEG